MSVTVDDRRLETPGLDAATIGDLLQHIQHGNQGRMIVNILLDGQSPEVDSVWAQPLGGRTLFVETADRCDVAAEVLSEIEQLIDTADVNRTEAVTHLEGARYAPAMEQLSQWFSTWQQAEKALTDVARALDIDLEQVQVDGQGLLSVFNSVADQLRQIKTSLQNKDYVTLGDILNYEAPACTTQWRGAVTALRTRARAA